MDNTLRKTITYSFFLLLFLVPIVFLPFRWLHTSELFEFNKMVLTYLLTTIIVGAWIVRMVVARKLVLRRTMLDVPLLVFLAVQILSTITSIDFRTSLLGFYSRFHGGLASSFSYALLYWAWVSNMGKTETKKAFNVLFASALLVSVYAVLQHFGIDKEVWVQDVQNRVFSSLGQPNWLAAWIVALSPLAWALFIKEKLNYKWFSLSALFFLVLLYTKSRSGVVAFAGAFTFFWAFEFWLSKKLKKPLNIQKPFGALLVVFVAFALAIGTPWTKPIFSPKEAVIEEVKPQGPALETGGTESGEIRKIVWQGALDLWKKYPLLGTGVETFGISYYFARPVEHNLVSEWDFLYNKAHNEYLNIAATTGSIGLLAYIALAGTTIVLIFKKKRLALLYGFLIILATNFFGFFFVPVATLFFMFPAFATTLDVDTKTKKKDTDFENLESSQKALLVIVFSSALFTLFMISRYWYADYIFAKGKVLEDTGNPVEAREYLTRATKLSPKEALFWDELAQANTDIAVALAQEGELDRAQEFAVSAMAENTKAVSLSPKNVNLLRSRANMFVNLATLDNNYLLAAKDALESAIALAPTEAKLLYNLGLTEARIGNTEAAIQILEKTIEMKSDYRNARFALAILLAEEGNREEAIAQLEYILEFINPEDTLVSQQLEEYR